MRIPICISFHLRHLATAFCTLQYYYFYTYFPGGLDRGVHSSPLPPETFLLPSTNSDGDNGTSVARAASSVSAMGDGFAGCIREVSVNGQWVPLTEERGWQGWQVGNATQTVLPTSVS